MTGYNDTPIFISNPYGISVKEVVNLFWGEVFRKFWYVFLFFAIPITKLLWENFAKPFPMNLFAPVLFTGVFLFARFRFIHALKDKPILMRTTRLYLFENRLEFVDSDSHHLIIHFSGVLKFSQRRIGYVVRTNTNRSLLVPLNCFKSEGDRVRFEMLLKSR